MKFYKFIVNSFFVLLLCMVLLPDDVFSIPAFARKYKVSCTTCHTVFPRLKAYGDEFAGSGFIIPEKENARSQLTAGDDLLWLNKDFPVAVRMDLFAAHDQGKNVENDLQIPWGIKLLSGGTLYKNIGYYFYFYMSETGEVAGIEDAYIHFDNIFNSNLDVMAGQFQTCDPLMKRELRLTYEDYEVYKFKAGLSNTNLTYDRGLILAYTVDKTSTDLIGMVVNGNGKAEAVDHKFDQDNYKNYGFRAKQALGEIVAIGGFYYTGKESRPDSGGINNVIYYGPDFTLGIGPIELTGQYLYRKDSNPFFDKSAKDVETTGIVLEILFAPDIAKSRYFFTGLYNSVDSDFYKYHTATLSYTYMIARNMRILTEYTRDLEEKKNRFVLGIVSAF